MEWDKHPNQTSFWWGRGEATCDSDGATNRQPWANKNGPAQPESLLHGQQEWGTEKTLDMFV